MINFDKIVYLSVFLSGILGSIFFLVTVEPMLTFFLGPIPYILEHNYPVYLGFSYHVICCLIPNFIISNYAVYLTERDQ